MKRFVLLSSVLALLPGIAAAAESPALHKDLAASLALLGQPCAQVVSAAAQGDRDYLVSCSDGNRYRVYVNAQGRVSAEKR
jgi:hypothetical protein